MGSKTINVFKYSKECILGHLCCHSPPEREGAPLDQEQRFYGSLLVKQLKFEMKLASFYGNPMHQCCPHFLYFDSPSCLNDGL